MKHRPLIALNWKANPDSLKAAQKLFAATKTLAKKYKAFDFVACAPSVFLGGLKPTSTVALGAQDFFWEPSGAFTGEVGFEALVDTKIRYAIIGHSERRAMGETDEMVGKKLLAALGNKVIAILCVGETSRDEKLAYLETIKTQLVSALQKVPKQFVKNIVVAYEPVWAIGKSATREATPEEVKEVAIFVKRVIGDLYRTKSVPPIKILYGGSVSHKNARMMLERAGVDGLLVGRASLDPKELGFMLQNLSMPTRS